MAKRDNKSRPGVMLYFDVRPCLKRLSLTDKGRLFEAILDFGEFGIVPEVDGALGVAWDFVQQRIDRDRDRYETIVEKRRQAANARWNNAQNANDANAQNAMQTMPTTTSTPTPTTTSTPTPTTTSTPTSTNSLEDRTAEEIGGVGERETNSPAPMRETMSETDFEAARSERLKMLDGYGISVDELEALEAMGVE